MIHAKKQESMTYILQSNKNDSKHENKQKRGLRNWLWVWADVLFDRYWLQSSHYNYVKKLNETMIKEIKEGVMIISNQIETINEEIQIVKKIQMEILVYNFKKYNKWDEKYNSIFELAKEIISELEDRSTEIMWSEQ